MGVSSKKDAMSHALVDHLMQAASFYRDQLCASSCAVSYLKSRGLQGGIAARYGLGYAPPGFNALRGVFPDYGARALVEAGLVAEGSGGRRYDRFRDRIMFPILDDAGDVIGFGGRVLEGDGPKYLNSPETEIFQKGGVLFGLWQAAGAIVSADAVFVVEGYIDVVSLAQHGVENAVATLGTATTGAHVERLLGLAKRVIFCFDGDEAGRRAAARAMEVCLPYLSDASDVGFLFLPNGHDPDSYVRAEGGDAFAALAYGVSTLEGFLVADSMKGCELEYAEGRARLVAMAAPRLRQIKAPGMVCRILTAIAAASKFSVDELRELIFAK